MENLIDLGQRPNEFMDKEILIDWIRDIDYTPILAGPNNMN